MKPNASILINPNLLATNGRKDTLAPNPQEQERPPLAKETPPSTPEVIEQKRAADSVAWQELLTQGPVNFSRVDEQVEPQQLASSAEDEEKKAAVLETLRIINERPISPAVLEQQAAVAEAERIITEHQAEQVETIIEQLVSKSPTLSSGGLIERTKDLWTGFTKHIDFKVFFAEFKGAMRDLWNKIRGKKEKPQPKVDLKEQEKIQNQQYQQQVNAQAERAYQTAELNEVLNTTIRYEIAGSTAEQRAQLLGVHANYESVNTPRGIAEAARIKKEREAQAQQPQGLPAVSTKKKPGLITVEQATNIEFIGGSGRVSGPTNKG